MVEAPPHHLEDAITAERPAPARPLPPVERVRPGLWSVPVPLPGLPRYVNVHVLETDRGPYLIDTGWDTDEAWDGLCAGLAGIGTSVADVQGVVVTHAHLDHYGLAGRVRAASGAWVQLHPLDAAQLDRYEGDPAEAEARVLLEAGAPADVVREAVARIGTGHRLHLPRPDRLIEDGDRPAVPGWDLRAVWTPGHSPGHVCLWDERGKVLLSGDHVLPRFAVMMARPEHDEDDPLGGYLRSLDRLEALGAQEVLPAHEFRFTGVAERLAGLRDHHRARLATALDAVTGGAEHAWDVAVRLAAPRRLGALTGFALVGVVSDTLAVLAALRGRGLVRHEPARGDRPSRWWPAA